MKCGAGVTEYSFGPDIKVNLLYRKVVMEHEVPIGELVAVADAIWDKSPEEQDLIREEKAKEFAAKYPQKNH